MIPTVVLRVGIFLFACGHLLVSTPTPVDATIHAWQAAQGAGALTYPTWLAANLASNAKALRQFHRTVAGYATPLTYNGADDPEIAAEAAAALNNHASYTIQLRSSTLLAQPSVIGGVFTYTISMATGCVTRATGRVAREVFSRDLTQPNSHATPFPSVKYYLQAMNGEIGGGIDQGHIIAHSLGGDGHDVVNYWGQFEGPNQRGRWRRMEIIAKKAFDIGGFCDGGVTVTINFNDCNGACHPTNCVSPNPPWTNVCPVNCPLRSTGGTYHIHLTDACFSNYYRQNTAAAGYNAQGQGGDPNLLDADFVQFIGRGEDLGVGNGYSLETAWLNDPADGGAGDSSAPQPVNDFSSMWRPHRNPPMDHLKPRPPTKCTGFTAKKGPGPNDGKRRKARRRARLNILFQKKYNTRSTKAKTISTASKTGKTGKSCTVEIHTYMKVSELMALVDRVSDATLGVKASDANRERCVSLRTSTGQVVTTLNWLLTDLNYDWEAPSSQPWVCELDEDETPMASGTSTVRAGKSTRALVSSPSSVTFRRPNRVLAKMTRTAASQASSNSLQPLPDRVRTH